MKSIDEILTAYNRQVSLPWVADTLPAGRVWIVWFDKAVQRRFTGRLGDFEQSTMKAGHGWFHLSLSRWFGEWIAQHEYFDALLEQPREIRGLIPDIEEALVGLLRERLGRCSQNDVLAVDGCGSLFGVARVSTLISRVAHAIPGRLLLSFPGTHSAGVYRLLDARDGWNYHAVPIPSDHAY